jgi:hypothetical protein
MNRDSSDQGIAKIAEIAQDRRKRVSELRDELECSAFQFGFFGNLGILGNFSISVIRVYQW